MIISTLFRIKNNTQVLHCITVKSSKKTREDSIDLEATTPEDVLNEHEITPFQTMPFDDEETSKDINDKASPTMNTVKAVKTPKSPKVKK